MSDEQAWGVLGRKGQKRGKWEWLGKDGKTSEPAFPYKNQRAALRAAMGWMDRADLWTSQVVMQPPIEKSPRRMADTSGGTFAAGGNW